MYILPGPDLGPLELKWDHLKAELDGVATVLVEALG